MQIYIILTIILVIILILILCICYENTALTISKYDITSSQLPSGADRMKFVVIADLHNNQFGEKNERLIRKIDELAPEFIIIAGDLFIAREYHFDYAYEFLKELSERYPIYYGYGNHEKKVEDFEAKLHTLDAKERERIEKTPRKIADFKTYKKKVKELGVHFLNNEASYVEINDKERIRIFGGTISLDYFKRLHRPVMTKEYLNACFGESKSEEYQILIGHNPMYFKQYAEWGADLVLAGHVHGGIVRIPFLGGVISPQMQIFPKYDAGLFEEKRDSRKRSMIVSRGLGLHTLKIRLLNRPELVCVTLRKEIEQ